MVDLDYGLINYDIFVQLTCLDVYGEVWDRKTWTNVYWVLAYSKYALECFIKHFFDLRLW